MRRRALAIAVGLVAVCAVPAGSGASASTVGATHLRLTPAAVGTGTTVVARFDQPQRGGLLPGQRTIETLSMTGSFSGGCVGTAAVSVPVGVPGAPTRERLRPGRMAGHRWCLGVHHVALVLAVSSNCPPAPDLHFCPQSAAVPTTGATASFRVTRG